LTTTKTGETKMIKLTEGDLRRVFPDARETYIKALINEQPFLAKHGILESSLRWCHFCAQIGHETNGLTIVRENMNYRANRIMQIFGIGRHSARVTWGEAARLAGQPYELAERVYGIGNKSMARRLGNTKAGDGYNFRGWGPGQVTGKGQSLRYGTELGVDLEATPELLEDAAIGLKAFVLEWEHRKLNQYADNNQGDAVSKGVNLGNPRSTASPNGLEDRRRWYRKALAQWRDADAGDAVSEIERATNFMVLRFGDDSIEVKALQERLAAMGYHLGKVDGIFGKETRRQVRAFQGDNGLTADGIVGPLTWTALRTAEDVDRGAREQITGDDLAARGSRTVGVARQVQREGLLAMFGGVGGLGAAFTIPQTISEIPAWIGTVRENSEAWSVALAWLFTPAGLVGMGCTIAVIYGARLMFKGQAIEQIRVEDAQTGANLGR